MEALLTAKNFPNTATAAETFGKNLLEQNFIFKRGLTRWLTHFLIMWGCFIGCCHISARVRMGPFQARGRPRIQGIYFWIRDRTAGRQKHAGLDPVSCARFYSLNGYRRLRHRDPPAADRPRSHRLSVIFAGFYSPFASDRDRGHRV